MRIPLSASPRHPVTALALAVMMTALIGGCFATLASRGGGQALARVDRVPNPADVAVPAGYRVELVATGLTFPTGVAFDAGGVPHVIEAGYSYGEVWTTPRLVRIEAGGRMTEVARGGRNGPWNGVAFHRGAFYVAEGGELEGGRILRIAPDGSITALVRDLPSQGDHHTNGPAIGSDGAIYFGQGTATNAAVVGTENADFGWLKRFPAFHDAPCGDIKLTGENFTSDNPLAPGGGKVTTGAFAPFGTPTMAGQIVRGRIPCSGAIFRIPPGGGPLELVAWGFRNPFGLAFSPQGQLYVTDNAYDDRGSRGVHGAGDLLWEVTPGGWHGWPDFHGARPLWEGDHYDSPFAAKPKRLLAEHPGRPPRPRAVLGVHSSATGFDFSRAPAFGHVGQAFIALFGDQAPVSGKSLAPVGFKVVRVDPATGVIEDFAVNRGRTNGPASRLGTGGIERPVAVRFDPAGTALYVADFGVMAMSDKGAEPRQGTGVVWRVVREERQP
jgi:glucose/arabinose dehydrogenase